MNEENNNRNEEQNTMNDQPQSTWRPDYTKQDSGQTDQGPQPMPSSDNMYRFQNVKAEQQSAPKERKQRNGGGMKRVIAAAVVFGVVAGVCFFGLVKITGFGNGSGSKGTIDTVDTSEQNTEVRAVSGAAAGPGDVSGIVDRVMPSIVAITETSTVSSYFGQYPTEGAGSGFIVKEDNNELLIVTNNHVVAGADSITVTFIDDTTAKATVKGTDSTADLAVISVKVSDLKDETKKSIKVASLGHSEDVKVGQMAIAIGNALGYGQSVTVGYISAKDREVEVGDDNSGSSNTMVLLQTDAAINPGNSGGALLDANGNVIGINSVKYADTKVEGIGYAIPMSDAIPIINELMNREVLKDEEKGYLGISGRTISEELSEAYGFPVGVFVSEVSDSGAAKKAGIKQGDIITKINGTKISTIEQVQNKVNNTKAGTEITVTIARSQEGEYKEQDVKVTLKSSETLDELDTDQNGNSSDNGVPGRDSNENNNENPYGYGGDSYYGGDQIVPW
ncbi:MAG: trypsin-like peptidase domain-containing protein [Roseburia sp.]|nr:trypsin-like peptidase domain-containing protein [Roseburia sp.]